MTTTEAKSVRLTCDFEYLERSDGALVGGKNSSLGELVTGLKAEGITVPPGFATTSYAYWSYVDANGIRKAITDLLAEWESGKLSLAEVGKAIRRQFLQGSWPANTAAAIGHAYRELSTKSGNYSNLSVAVRSSATAEDLPDASFAGQLDSFLNISGEAAVLNACRRCYASLFTDRAISYRQAKGFDHLGIALSIGIQRMVRADTAGSGVMFTIDTESGFDKVVLINAAWGLGENVVQGAIDPDEYQVFKPFLAQPGLVPIIDKKCGGKEKKMVFGGKDSPTYNVPTSKAERAAFVLGDEEILQLARWACIVERHYGSQMDIEWAKDGITGELFIVQARPETVHSRGGSALKIYHIGERGRTLTTGFSVGDAAFSGRVCLIESAKDIDRFVDDSILVTGATDPDWVPIMKRAAAIVTDHGGRTSHAAIVSRELGVPAVVGTGNATYLLHTGQEVTVSCAEGNKGFVYQGRSAITCEAIELGDLPTVQTHIMLNLANPAAAYRWWRLPIDGIGLARMEFLVSNIIRVHPMAFVHFYRLTDAKAQQKINRITAGYESKPDYFVDKLSQGFAALCALVYPKPAIIRMSDFKTNEYAGLIGGAEFEPREGNPMIGFRGAARYYSPQYREGFALECQAIKRLRERLGFTNAVVMIPFCRSVDEARRVLDVMAENGLRRGVNGLRIYVMCQIPSNMILASQFMEHFDGLSIGFNDLTQLTLGVDCDSSELAYLFDEQNDAVKWMIARAIAAARQAGCEVSLCGQAPSDDPKFARFLVEAGITSISVSPDTFIAVRRNIGAAERA
ncbi:hypothetical protein BJY04DRAFT_199390 [Aspergillus karnatakaensis]|uniref:phosphoenolpyruvate synthase n=1 Tax=Aspergillus karnatakaensis TaxID=1810916 RepID=UPI003CCCA2F6